VARALCKEREGRIASAAAFAEAIRPFADCEARMESPAVRLGGTTTNRSVPPVVPMTRHSDRFDSKLDALPEGPAPSVPLSPTRHGDPAAEPRRWWSTPWGGLATALLLAALALARLLASVEPASAPQGAETAAPALAGPPGAEESGAPEPAIDAAAVAAPTPSALPAASSQKRSAARKPTKPEAGGVPDLERLIDDRR